MFAFSPIVRRQLRIAGVVQGVGFRPFVWRLAQELSCTGWVCNDSSGVEIEIQGRSSDADKFRQALVSHPPPLARITSIEEQAIHVCENENSFEIRESRSSHGITAYVSPDIATCNQCLLELRDVNDRRFAYPFINCTHCGPRFTIQTDIPYDRQQTTMRKFELCELCAAEYTSPADRRFHAQPNACPQCGPTIWLVPSQAATRMHAANESFEPVFAERANSPEILATVAIVRDMLADGKTVAIKGLGGFHLACDARNSAAVQRLRERKQRPFKPLAVMVADLETASSLVQLSEAAKRLLASRERPIVLQRKLHGNGLAAEVAPANPYLGILLPYTPLQHLLLQQGDAWVMTSGNVADEPIAFDNAQAVDRLSSLCDAFLMHNRPIHTVCDDSVVREMHNHMIPIRRSRGYAPLPIQLSGAGPDVSAIGGEIKTTICVTRGCNAFLSQHIGDMGNRETLHALERAWEQMHRLYQMTPEIIAADLHPGYVSTQWARDKAQAAGTRFVQVQHHHAHAASLIEEHGLPRDLEIIACVFDGTGYGSDRAIWGGEFLIASTAKYQRATCLRYARLPGGDSCIALPAKTALAFLHDYGIEWSSGLPSFKHFSDHERRLLHLQLVKNINSIPTSSMGRMFDVVASILDVRHKIDYEGQAAVELEAMAEEAFSRDFNIEPYPYALHSGEPNHLDFAATLRALIADFQAGEPTQRLAARWHQTVAHSTVAVCKALRQSRSDLTTVGLTGGVFQNAILSRLIEQELVTTGFQVLTHRTVPCNDGGLALGQAAIAQCTAQS